MVPRRYSAGLRSAAVGSDAWGATEKPVVAISAFGGPESVIGQTRSGHHGGPTWSASGDVIVIEDRASVAEPMHLARLVVATGEKAALTRPGAECGVASAWCGDHYPAFLPGRSERGLHPDALRAHTPRLGRRCADGRRAPADACRGSSAERGHLGRRRVEPRALAARRSGSFALALVCPGRGLRARGICRQHGVPGQRVEASESSRVRHQPDGSEPVGNQRAQRSASRGTRASGGLDARRLPSGLLA